MGKSLYNMQKSTVTKKKIWIPTCFALKSSFKVPASGMPSQVDHESVQKRDGVPGRVVTSSQAVPIPASCSHHCLLQ